MHQDMASLNEEFLSRSFTTTQKFEKEYRRLFNKKAKTEKLYHHVLLQLKSSILEDDLSGFKKLGKFLGFINSVENQITRMTYFEKANVTTNFVILACRQNKEDILAHLLDNCKVLDYLSVDIGKDAILPGDLDETGHDAFYYAIRSNNVKLIDILIDKWPGDYLTINSEELEALLSEAYEALNLKNILVCYKMQIAVECRLINLRFFCSTPKETLGVEGSLDNIEQRVKFLLDNIDQLKSEYSIKKVDSKFLFIARCIAISINALKRMLKSTYDKIPWEEMEFCLVMFISYYAVLKEIHLIYFAFLDKCKLLDHLSNFAECVNNNLNNVDKMQFSKLRNVSNLPRDQITQEITNNCYWFKQLYDDFQNIRDICSLDKISGIINLAISVDAKEKDDQLIITRALQVIGEHMKNSLESPKLSRVTCELLLVILPQNTRNIIKDLRNSLSHAHSLNRRSEIEENADTNFYCNIQNDIKKIGVAITDIFYKYKIETIRKLLSRISCGSVEEIRETGTILENIKMTGMSKTFSPNSECEKIENAAEQLWSNITEKTYYEIQILEKIKEKIKIGKADKVNGKGDYVFGYLSLTSLGKQICNVELNVNNIRIIKFAANSALKNLPTTLQSYSLKEISDLFFQLSRSVCQRMNNIDATSTFFSIFQLTQFDNIEWIEELQERLKGIKISNIFTIKHNNKNKLIEDKYSCQFSQKQSQLQRILSDYDLSSQLTESFPSYKNDNKLQVAIEMLVLDLLSILGSSNNRLTDNNNFLEDESPLLIGKCLRNHLAHHNSLIDILMSDSTIAVILNARLLAAENIKDNSAKIGKHISDNFSKLTENHNRKLVSIFNQEKLLLAMENGDLRESLDTISKGADIYGRSSNLWTALHFAAKSPSLEIVKYLVDNNLDILVKDHKGQSPLHIAATYGRESIIGFLIKSGANVNELDENGETPLHLAAFHGHKDAVQVLLNLGANTANKDIQGYAPLHYSVVNNFQETAKILLKEERNVDSNEVMGGFTSLHIAAERGHLDFVDFLLQHGANVNAKTDRESIPLHTAALNGHLEIVNLLLSKGANVNSRVTDGCSALHFAAENHHTEIVKVLLKHRSNVNVVDSTYKFSPLHYAAKDGNLEILKTLLQYEATANVSTVNNMTPLHYAAENGHLEIVRSLIQHGVDINASTLDYDTSLHLAVSGSHEGIINILIECGAKINAQDIKGNTPLHIAATFGNVDSFKSLIRHGASFNIPNNTGLTSLHVAASNNQTDIIIFLEKKKSDVNIKDFTGIVPLHLAALNGHQNAINLLIQSNADVNARDNRGCSPLHFSCMSGHESSVRFLLQNGAYVDAKDEIGSTPMHRAIESKNNEVVEALINYNATINMANEKDKTPLCYAVRQGCKEIVATLIKNGANVNEMSSTPLQLAVIFGHIDIVKILLRNKADVNAKLDEESTILHIAAGLNYKIVEELIAKGANINSTNSTKSTPLHMAAESGKKRIVELLLSRGANVNAISDNGSPLHSALVDHGHENVIQLLLDKGVDIFIKDKKNRTALELAVVNGHLQVTKMLLGNKKIDINAKGNNDFTVLHIAAQGGNLEAATILIDMGANINAKNDRGSKPIHIAAREGHIEIVDLFLEKGMSINDPGASNHTLLHFAAQNNQLKVMKYLVKRGINVNSKSLTGATPLHVAAAFGFTNIVEFLLANGAIIDSIDIRNIMPIEIANSKEIISLLESTNLLFIAVKSGCFAEVENRIREGASVNAGIGKSGAPLHYAAWKGFDDIISLLLKNRANVNATWKNGFTPLHYAAKFSHFKVVKTLLSHGAIFNAISDTGKLPIEFAENVDIKRVLKLVNQSFSYIESRNTVVINMLNKITDIDIIKSIMNSRNKDNKSLVVAAVHAKFSDIEQLKQIFQDDNISTKMIEGNIFFNQGHYVNSYRCYEKVFLNRCEILGSDNPGTLDRQVDMAKSLYKQGIYQRALDMLQEISHKQIKTLGQNSPDALKTRSTMALVLYRQDKGEEALHIFQDVYSQQKILLGQNHSDTWDTRFHMALVLDNVGKFDEALSINRAVFRRNKESFGPNEAVTLFAQNNIAMVLVNQGKYGKAMKVYRDVYNKKKATLGPTHTDTLRTLQHIAGTLLKQNKQSEAMQTFNEVLRTQKVVLGQLNPETLITQINIGKLLLLQGKFIGALKIFSGIIEHTKTIFGPNTPHALEIEAQIEIIKKILKSTGVDTTTILQNLQRELHIAASNNDLETIKYALKQGADVNDKDADGATPLHCAINFAHLDVVTILLEMGSDVTQATNKGNTPLHTATLKGHREIIQILLKNVNQIKLTNFIDAQTITTGTTSLHIAAKSGFSNVVNCLLGHGATFNLKNRNGKSPLDLSNDQGIIYQLKLTEDLFEDAKVGNLVIISKLESVSSEEFIAVTHARNDQRKTLLQVAIANRHKLLAEKLLQLIQINASLLS